MTSTTEHTLLPDVAAYFAQKEEAQKAYDAHRIEYNKMRTENDRLYQAIHRDRFDALAEASDPLVAWIGRNCRDYPDYVETVLKALPCPLEKLDAIAETEGWCSDWQRFKDRAERAGVLPAYAENAARNELRRWIRREYGTAPQLNQRIDALIQAEAERAVEEYKAAQAANDAETTEA